MVVRDYDAGANAQTELTLIRQQPGENFWYNSRTRSIMTNTSLDRETEDTYYIEMLAVDKGNPSQTGTGTLTVTVQDVNDNPPYFTKTYEVSIT